MRYILYSVISLSLLGFSSLSYGQELALKNRLADGITLLNQSVDNNFSNSGSCQNGLCFTAITPGAMQWVSLPQSTSSAVLNYQVCTSVSGSTCNGYLANISVTFSDTHGALKELLSVNATATGVSAQDFTLSGIGAKHTAVFSYHGDGGGSQPPPPSDGSLTVVFHNASPSVAHVDYTGPGEFTITPEPDNNDNVPYYSDTTFTTPSSEQAQSIQIAQYGDSNFLTETPQCYFQFTASGGSWTETPDSSNVDCSIKDDGNNHFTISLAWPDVPAINYHAIGQNLETIVKGYMDNKSDGLYLVPNQMPLSQDQLNDFVSAAQTDISNGWVLQFGYDAVRMPLWLGAFYQHSARASQPATAPVLNYLTQMDQFISQNTCTTENGLVSVDANGFWAYTVPNVATDGEAVATVSCENKPALEGPLAVEAMAVEDTQLQQDLITSLNSYDLDDNTWEQYLAANGTQLNESSYSDSSSPYFNATLDLLSEAMIIGHGSLDISSVDSTGSSNDYANYTQFMTNYNKWLNDGFVDQGTDTAPLTVPDPADSTVTQDAARVIFSPYNALSYTYDKGGAGGYPTVSEGMGYGLLISYAANDQATFDKFLWYVLSLAKYQGCAQMTEDLSSCAVKSEYLMPWMVDITQHPFNYAIAGGFYTSGSASDADFDIIWALSLASQRVHQGAWANHLFDGQNYLQVAQAMENEVNRYEINKNVSYYGNELAGDGELFSPGSQWGKPLSPTDLACDTTTVCGTDLVYPGYINPEAFMAMQTVEASTGSSNVSH